MTRDVLAKANELSNVRYHILDYELREADYRQIQRWGTA